MYVNRKMWVLVPLVENPIKDSSNQGPKKFVLSVYGFLARQVKEPYHLPIRFLVTLTPIANLKTSFQYTN